MQQIRRRRLGTLAWRAMLVRFSGSGLTIKAFCRREAVSTASFYRWRTLLGAQATAVQTRPARSVTDTFVDLGPLMTPDSVPARFDLRLDLGGGLILQLRRD